jgi:hypothetical protein
MANILDPVSLYISINAKMQNVGKFALKKWLIVFSSCQFLSSRTGCITRNSPNSIGCNYVRTSYVKQTSSLIRVATSFLGTEEPAKLCLLLLGNQ